MHVLPVPAEGLPVVWDNLKGLIAEVCETSNGRFSPDTLKEAIEAKEFQLYMLFDGEEFKAIVLTQILHYRTGMKEIRVVCGVGSDYSVWAHPMERFLEAGARQQGFGIISALSRPGWEKVFKPLGFTKTHVLIEKALQ